MSSSYDIYDPTHSRNSVTSVPSVSQPDYPTSDQSRVLPRQLSTGSLRGTQNVGYGDTKIDGSNNVIRVGSIVLDGSKDVITVTGSDGSVLGIGTIPGIFPAESGFFSLDTDGNLIMKIVNGTQYVYNPTDNFVNISQAGLLPDGSAGFVVAKPGINVTDAYS